MTTRIDTANAGRTAGALALLDRIDGEEEMHLGSLSGADLCLLGATQFPVCWGALRDAWWRLDERGQRQLTEINTLLLLRRGLIVDVPLGGDLEALTVETCHPMSAELSVLLGARQSATFISATRLGAPYASRTYFPARGGSDPGSGVGAFVEESLDLADGHEVRVRRNPLAADYGYQLLNQALTVEELSAYALGPSYPDRPPGPPRSICFFESPSSYHRDSYEMVIYGHGEEFHVDINGPGLSFDLDREGVILLIAELVAQASM